MLEVAAKSSNLNGTEQTMNVDLFEASNVDDSAPASSLEAKDEVVTRVANKQVELKQSSYLNKSSNHARLLAMRRTMQKSQPKLQHRKTAYSNFSTSGRRNHLASEQRLPDDTVTPP